MQRALSLVCAGLDGGSDPGPRRAEALLTLRAVRATSKAGREAADHALERLTSLTPRNVHLQSVSRYVSLWTSLGFEAPLDVPHGGTAGQ